MQKMYAYANLSVFRTRNGHIIIKDPSSHDGKPQNLYFDLHDATDRLIDIEELKQVSEISGKHKMKACQIYNHWKIHRASEFLITQAKEIFPFNGSITGAKEQKMQRSRAIREFCQRQNIQHLVHFTHVENLSNILRLGLIGRDQVREAHRSAKFRINDDQRIDGCPEAVCLSISFPNYKMFYKYNHMCPEEWVVISLRPEILWELDCAFCCENAASNNVRFIPLETRRQIKALIELFQDFGRVKRSDLNIPDWFPTNPQAEVLVFNPIHTRYIKKVYYKNYQARDDGLRNIPFITPELLEVDEYYFFPRYDHRFWQNQNSSGDDSIGFFEGIGF